jgi:DNA-directed RNA polymerase subunit RPC12/RpoP
MPEARDRKRDPHRCSACGTNFDVTYFDERRSDRNALPGTTVDVACPECGHPRSVLVPVGAERTIVVERDEIGETDEGGGG